MTGGWEWQENRRRDWNSPYLMSSTKTVLSGPIAGFLAKSLAASMVTLRRAPRSRNRTASSPKSPEIPLRPSKASGGLASNEPASLCNPPRGISIGDFAKIRRLMSEGHRSNARQRTRDDRGRQDGRQGLVSQSHDL